MFRKSSCSGKSTLWTSVLEFLPSSHSSRGSRRSPKNKGVRSGRRAGFRKFLLAESLERRDLLAAYVVDTPSDIVADDGLTSLREAILYANSNPGADAITFAPGIAQCHLL